jgi:hypothetical protein
MNPKRILAAAVLIVAAGMGCIEEEQPPVPEKVAINEITIEVDRSFESIYVGIHHNDGWRSWWESASYVNPDPTVQLEDGSYYTYDLWYLDAYGLGEAGHIFDFEYWDLYAMNDTAILDYCLAEEAAEDEASREHWRNVENATQAEIDRQMGARSTNPSPDDLAPIYDDVTRSSDYGDGFRGNFTAPDFFCSRPILPKSR